VSDETRYTKALADMLERPGSPQKAGTASGAPAAAERPQPGLTGTDGVSTPGRSPADVGSGAMTDEAFERLCHPATRGSDYHSREALIAEARRARASEATLREENQRLRAQLISETRITALNERDALRKSEVRLRAALLGVAKTRQFGPCWCDTIAGMYCAGQDECHAAAAALAIGKGGVR